MSDIILPYYSDMYSIIPRDREKEKIKMISYFPYLLIIFTELCTGKLPHQTGRLTAGDTSPFKASSQSLLIAARLPESGNTKQRSRHMASLFCFRIPPAPQTADVGNVGNVGKNPLFLFFKLTLFIFIFLLKLKKPTFPTFPTLPSGFPRPGKR